MKFRYESARACLVSVGTALLMAAAATLGGCAGMVDEPTGNTAQEVTGVISITGTIFDANGNPLSGVTVQLNGSAQRTATTGAAGTYSFTGLGNGSYSVQPSLSGCSFAPSAVNLNNLTASTVVNFDGSGSSCGGPSANSGATVGSLSISGVVTNAAGNPVRGVRILLNGNTQAVRTTTAAGSYTFQVNPGSYSLNPTGSCSFTPDVANLNNITTNRTQNFVAGPGCGSVVDAGVPDARDSGSDARDATPDRCVPTTCAAAGRVCGPLADGCGGTLQCGTCGANQTCSAAGQCVNNCVPTTCAAIGHICGTAPDGCGGTLQCGTCPSGQACNATTGQCATTCVPATCAGAGRVCGPLADGCGGTLQCGTCAANQTCSAAGQCVNNCVPTTCAAAGRVCGPLADGCGGTLQCGTCAAGQSCNAAGQCVTNCVPTTCAAAGRVCGPLANGCGATLQCGTCAANQTCSAAGQCVNNCVPTTCAAAGRVCGTLADGCGATLQCGTCGANQTCSAAGQCVNNCVPTTCAAAGRVCGTLADGCGATLQCGTCPTGQTCNATGQCIAPANPCDVSTTDCMRAQDKSPSESPSTRCFQCASDNGCFDPAQQGGVCETVAGNAPASCAAATGLPAPTEARVCLHTLKNIFSSQCAATLQETPCLCGTTDAAQCLAGTAAPTGPLFSTYTCDLGANVSTIVTNFTIPTFGSGQANAIVQCAAAFGCNCF